jgi:hypothetical protein
MTDEANLNAPREEEPLEEISPAADAAMRKLKELFSDPAIAAQARFRCSTEGPDDTVLAVPCLTLRTCHRTSPIHVLEPGQSAV